MCSRFNLRLGRNCNLFRRTLLILLGRAFYGVAQPLKSGLVLIQVEFVFKNVVKQYMELEPESLSLLRALTVYKVLNFGA